MGFIFRFLLILVFIGVLAAVVTATLAVIWMAKKLLEMKSVK